MKLNNFFLSAIAGSLLLVSCSSDDGAEAPLGSYDNGILVLNEGGLGTVTYISDDLAVVQQDIFTAVNGENLDLGAYTQSIFFDGDRAFIISNGSNKITVVNRYTFEYIDAIATGLTVPRYGVVYNGKAYVTNSNAFDNATDDFIAVINLSDLSVEAPIAVNNQAEKLIEENGNLYVSGGFYGLGDKVTVIDASARQIVTTITVGESPNSLEEKDGFLYVLCGTWGAPGKIVKVKLSDHSIASEIAFADTVLNPQNLDVENDMAYFTSGAKIYRFALNASAVSDTPFVDTGSDSDYIGYGFAVKDERVYISEAAEDFSSNGSVLVYSAVNGALLDEIPVGLGPNGFYFN